MARYLTCGDLRRHYGRAIGRDRIYKLMNAGHLKSIIINGKRVVLESEVERFDRLLQSGPVVLKDTDGSILIERSNP